MIQLYKKGNTNYDKNGDHTLAPISCFLDRKLNGSWELTIEVPLDERRAYKDLTMESVIKAPTPNGDKLFYVYDTDKVSEDSVEASARPIFLCAASDAFLLDVRPTSKSGQEALDIMTAGTVYTGKSNITTVNTAYYVRKNLIEAIASDDENSFLNRWGGEILYDDFDIIINDRVGGDYGVKIMYGRNLEAVEEHSNIEEVVTRIIPVAFNGYTLEGDAPWVDSPIIDSYERPHIKVIKFEDVKLTEDCYDGEVGFDTLEGLRAELIRRCEAEYEKGIDKPTVTLGVNMIDLSKTVEYRDYAVLEEVDLGDTVGCIHEKIGIETSARVIGQKWDCILKRNEKLTIGDFESSYFDKLTSTANAVNKVIDRKNQTVMADRVAGILNGIHTQLRYQKNNAQRQDVRAILFEDTDPDSSVYGALAIGTQGFQIANKRTADDKDWDWTTAFTANGGYADAIILGILGNKDASSYWDLDRGKIVIKLGGSNDDRGVMELYDSEGNLTGSFTSTGGDLRNMTIRDRILLYNAANTKNLTMGFSGDDFYISGSDIIIHLPAINVVGAVIEELTGENITMTGNIQGNVLKAITSMYSPYYSGTDMYLEKKLTADGDVIGDGVSLKNHTHKMIVGSNHSLVMNYSGGSYVVPKKTDGETADSGAVTLGGNSNKFKAVYAVEGTIQTSDEREKDIIGGLDERHRKLFRELKPILYRWKNGDKRLHAGFGAQTTEKAMRKNGITSEEQFCVRVEEGSYNMTYDELIPLIVDVLQDVVERLEG